MSKTVASGMWWISWRRGSLGRLGTVLVAGLIFGLSAGSASAGSFGKAVADYEIGRYDAAYLGFVTALAQGDGRGRYYIAMMHKDGLGVPQDPGRALAWFDCAAASSAPMAVSARVWRDLLKVSLPASVVRQATLGPGGCQGIAAAGPAVAEQVTYRDVLKLTQSETLAVPGTTQGRRSSMEHVFIWPVELTLGVLKRAVAGFSGGPGGTAHLQRPAGSPDTVSVILVVTCWVVLALAAIGLKSTWGAVVRRRREAIPATSL